MFVLNQDTIEFDLQAAIDHSQAQVDSITEILARIDEDSKVLDTALDQAGAASVDIMNTNHGFRPEVQATITGLVAILGLTSTLALTLRYMARNNRKQYGLTLEYHTKQLEMLLAMKESVLAGATLATVTKLPVQ